MDNLNSNDYLDKTKLTLLNILSEVEAAPSVQIHTGQVDSALHPAPMDLEPAAEKDDEGEQPSSATPREHPPELATN